MASRSLPVVACSADTVQLHDEWEEVEQMLAKRGHDDPKPKIRKRKEKEGPPKRVVGAVPPIVYVNYKEPLDFLSALQRRK